MTDPGLSTHPSTEAVGQVRRDERELMIVPAPNVRWPAVDGFLAGLLRKQGWLSPAEAEKLRADWETENQATLALLAALREAKAERAKFALERDEVINERDMLRENPTETDVLRAEIERMATFAGQQSNARRAAETDRDALLPVVEAAVSLPTDVLLGLAAAAAAAAQLPRKRTFYQALFDQLTDFEALVDKWLSTQTPAGDQ